MRRRRFLYGRDDTGDALAVPRRPKQPITEAEDHQVQDHFLADKDRGSARSGRFAPFERGWSSGMRGGSTIPSRVSPLSSSPISVNFL